MGFFSFYCGIIYNDFTSIPLYVLEDSCYVHDPLSNSMVLKDKDCVYKVGLDPSWYMGKNELTYVNSLKMKISVILGVL